MPSHSDLRTARSLFAVVLGSLALAVLPGGARSEAFHSTAIDITPDGQEVWVVNPDIHTVSVIATQGVDENTMVAEIPVGRDPWCVDIHPTNGEVWVSSYRDDRITIIDGPSRTVIDTIDTGYETFGVAFSPDGTQAIVSASGADKVHVIDVATRAITSTSNVYRRPRGIAWDPDGTRAWVSHLLTPSYFARLTQVDPAAGTTSEILMRQVFGTEHAGYPSAMQSLSLSPAAGDSMLWIPCVLINSAKGGLSGIPLTFTNIFHAAIRPVNVNTGEDLNWDTYFLSDGGTPNKGFNGTATPVGGSVAVDFVDGRAYVANLHSNDVTVLNDDVMNLYEIRTFAAGNAPIGVVTHTALGRVYVANWLSRDVTVFDVGADEVVATVPTITTELLDPHVLNGKQLFFTSTGRMSFENRNSCGNCHVYGRPDARLWDLSQFGGRHLRATRDWRGSGYTPPYGWTGYFDEIQDNEWSVRGLLGGVGLIDGTPNPSLGPPNAGLSRDLDDLSMFIALEVPRGDTPYQNPDGTLTAAADSGQVLFNDPAVGCAVCHIPPLYMDGSMDYDPFLLHDVGTSEDSTTAAGLDTPSLCAVWDGAPYLHTNRALTMVDVLTTFNPEDKHGVTSQLSPEQIGFLAEFVLSIGWPDGIQSPVAAPEVAPSPNDALATVFPNPFRDQTSVRFAVTGQTSQVRLEIYDVAGRRVATPLDRPATPGEHVVGWSTRDAQGRPVAPGVYFARLTVDGRDAGSKKMTVVR